MTKKTNKKKDQLCQFGFILMAMVRRYKLLFLELASSALQFLYAHLKGFRTQLFLNGVAPDSVTHTHYYCQCRGQFCTLKESPSSHMLESITVQNTTFPTQASKIQDGQNELLYHPKLTTSTAQSLYI